MDVTNEAASRASMHDSVRRPDEILYFHMVQNVVTGKWFRVGKPYRNKETATGWIAFTRSAWIGHKVRLRSYVVKFDENGRISKRSAEKLDKVFNLEVCF